ncbi:tetratricopeptide repeat protein [Streptomyces chartreusis]|uniref:tetratricopeptide repeat protein n=1 Tax=Streptomyces chartreusis TaxID=1969 RepID=UPI003685BB14
MAKEDEVAKVGGGPAVSNRISGGVFFQAVIQGRDITVVLPPAVTPALSGLPAPSATFTGRDTHVEELLEGLAPSQETQRAVLVASRPSRAAVAGLAGVGKTELVVQTATRALRKPGWFPGGVLFVDLFGYDAKRRLSPERALDGLLRALGMPGEHIPEGLQDRTRLYRSVLGAFAEQGRRVLVVIDNAYSAEQANPLLPGDGITAALLTSRHTLDVDARLHDLDILDERASIELLRQALLQARGPSDTRVADAPDAAAAIAQLCAGLPLALRIAAALLADTPTRPLASLAQALEAEHTRLDELSREDRAVRAAFDLSYQHLEPDHARLFRLLPLNPGPDLSTEAASHLTGTLQRQADRLLQGLARAHLIEPGPVWGRWRQHDLVRLYADEKGNAHAGTDQRDAARARLFDFYRKTAEAADTHLLRTPSEVRSPRFPDRNAAMAWLAAERDSLVATATTPGYPEASAALAGSLAQFLNYGRSFDDLITITAAALAACRELRDRHGEARALNNLGIALAGARRFQEAIDAHRRSLAICRELRDRSDRRDEAMALYNLGAALREVRRFGEAIDAHTQALALYRELRDRHGEARALNDFASALQEERQLEGAIDAYIQATALYRELHDPHGEAGALTNLGGALREAHRFGDAVTAHTQAVAIFRADGDRHREAMALNNLGLALYHVGRLEEAVDAHTRVTAFFGELGDRYGEAKALNNLGIALAEMGQPEEAVEPHTQAAALYRETRDCHGEAMALNNLGTALREVGLAEEAVEPHTRAVALYRETRDRYGEGQALDNLGMALAGVRRFNEAIDAHSRALAIFREIGEPDSERIALANLRLTEGRAGHLHSGHHPETGSRWRGRWRPRRPRS